MPFEAPQVTAHDVGRARFILEQVATRLLEADPTIRDDNQLFADMLDSECGAQDLLRAALRASLEADAAAKACKGRIEQLAARQGRHEAHAEALRGAVHQAMRDIGLPRLKDPEFTAFRSDGKEKVEVQDPEKLPAEFIRTKKEPDRTALLGALKAGKEIPGAALTRADETLTVKVK